jgi:DNA-binding transcriptional LysR family regulator
MINIPTELLRTLVAVVDLRSFTKAAQSLGVTQPAVSAQIKRLQVLLDSELFDKSAPGVSLTPSGRLVVNFARRMLSINDQIVEISVPKLSAQSVRIGVSGGFAAPLLPPLLAEFKLRYPALRFLVRSEHFDIVSRDLRQGDLDLLIGLSEGDVMMDARHQWAEPMVWVRNPSLQLDDDAPVPLVTFGENCAYHRLALRAFSKAERPYEIVFVGASEASICAAVSSGLGISAMSARMARRAGFEPWEDAPLPPVGDVFCGIYLGENGDRIVLEELADAVRDLLYSDASSQGAKALSSQLA